MTDLQRIEIDGFKGIERLTFEPSGVNLVTGRNNTGKTSLLEAMALAFDPTHVEEFGEDIDSLIHESREECRIMVETEEGVREMEIRHPTEEEMHQFFVIPISLYFLENRRVSINTGSGIDTVSLDEMELPEFNDLNYIASEIVRTVLSEYMDSDSRSGFQEESLVFKINGNKYPYLVVGNSGKEVVKECGNRLFDEIEKRLTQGRYRNAEINDIRWSGRFSHPFTSESVPEFGFVNEPSTQEDATTFIKSKNLLSAPDFEPDSGDAIKRDDLGDYLKETGLADELKTFNLDELVFQKEDGEKYSVPYDFMGDGFKTMVGLLWELMDDEVENQIVLLEEPENHMHPGYVLNVVHFLVELARDENVQLFITTHNKDFIDAFFNENRSGEQAEFLEEEFTLLQMQRDSAVVEDYETAREDLEELHLDLRGI